MKQSNLKPALNEKEITQVLETLVGGFRQAVRSPILKKPSDYDLEYEDVWFPAQDGVPLEAWFIPREGSNKLIIANHPKSFNRYGFASHLEPWKRFAAIGGNDFEVNFIRDYKILHDAGYNVLTYDLRNHGHSGAANGGLPTSGIYEYRDVIGSLDYARTRRDLRAMEVGLFSRCFGCNSTIVAMARSPEHFNDVRCLIALQPLSPRMFLERYLELAGIPADRIDDLDRQIQLITSFRLDEMSPMESAKSVTVPTFMCQVHDDAMTRPKDVQHIFNHVSAKDKELFWIEGTTRRWDGYNYFSKDPSKMLAWFDKHMS